MIKATIRDSVIIDRFLRIDFVGRPGDRGLETD